MRIGILTLPFNNNYGGLLQSHALQNYLKRRGHSVLIINRIHEESKDNEKFTECVKYVLRKVLLISHFRKLYNKLISKEMRAFEECTMIFSEPILSDSDFRKLEKYHFDALIVGSDQVWRFDYTRSLKYNYFLDFAQSWHVKRIAYAASFGVDNPHFDKKETEIITNCLKEFAAISVREFSGIDICKNQFNLDVDWMIDPAFLISRKDYELIIRDSTFQKKGLCLYLLDRTTEKLDLSDRISATLNLNSYSIGPQSIKFSFQIKNNKYPPLCDWLKGIHESSFVVTDSFHGCVFAILFNKPFIAIGNRERGMTRFKTLLSIFELEKQLLSSVDDYNSDILKHEFDYPRVNKIISDCKKRSDVFFQKIGL
ncbi:MAG: polysaccharide pyruvyl transferase family protein [Bacteroidales bacterium]|nr:polysaccharide pyruvyl transferase family protein [Bacteroidales bacterium]